MKTDDFEKSQAVESNVFLLEAEREEQDLPPQKLTKIPLRLLFLEHV